MAVSGLVKDLAWQESVDSEGSVTQYLDLRFEKS